MNSLLHSKCLWTLVLLFALPLVSRAATVIDRSGTLTTAYTVRDHLGSTRAVVGRDGTVLECDEYYPFGTRHDLGRNYPVLASNRFKYNGKEQQDIASLSLPYLDYGARLYNPAILRWNAQDPLQEKYYGVSPFAYCGNNPVNFYDPDGRDIYTINSDSNVEFYRKTDDKYDVLFAAWGDGPLDENAAHVKINDQSILQSIAQGNNPSGSCSRKDMKNIFMFAADTFNSQEWGLYYNKESYELTTKESSSGVVTSLNDVTWKIHSHPNVDTDQKAEIESMGYEPWGSGWYPFSGDAAISKSLHNNNPGHIQTSLVYMVNSKRIYEINVTPGPGPRDVTKRER